MIRGETPAIGSRLGSESMGFDLFYHAGSGFLRMTCEGRWGDSEREIGYSEQDWGGLNTWRCAASEISQTSAVAETGAQIKPVQ